MTLSRRPAPRSSGDVRPLATLVAAASLSALLLAPVAVVVLAGGNDGRQSVASSCANGSLSCRVNLSGQTAPSFLR